MRIPTLLITTPNERPYAVRVGAGRVTLGRGAGCEVVLSDKLISSRHLEIFTNNGQVRFRDLGSTNGIFVNGVRRVEGVLRAGDNVRLGNSVARFSLEVEEEALDAFADVPTNRTVIDPFSIKLSLERVEADLAEAPTASPAASELVRERLMLLYRLGHDVNHLESRPVWLERLARLMRETIGPERVAVLTFDEPATAVSALAADPVFSRDCTLADPATPVYVPRSFLAQVVDEQKAILYDQLDLEPRFRNDAELVRRGVTNLMAAPLVVDRGVVGVFYLDRSSPEPFTADDLHLLGVLANQSAVMLENLRLFAETERALEELKRAQEQLVHAAKLSALGELVAGIAHEINNPLAGVLGFTQLLKTRDGVPADARLDLAKIEKQAVRVKSIVEKLLIFADRGPQQALPVAVNEVAREALELVQYDFAAHHVAVELALAPSEPLVSGDRGELRQVLVNLLHNADQALAPRGRGRVAIETRAAGGRVEVAIRDDGPGIAPDLLTRIFDPFFTLRPVGQGMGLGLSVAAGIVTRRRPRLRAAARGGRRDHAAARDGRAPGRAGLPPRRRDRARRARAGRRRGAPRRPARRRRARRARPLRHDPRGRAPGGARGGSRARRPPPRARLARAHAAPPRCAHGFDRRARPARPGAIARPRRRADRARRRLRRARRRARSV